MPNCKIINSNSCLSFCQIWITYAYETFVIKTMEPIMLYTKLVILLYSFQLNLYAYDVTCSVWPYLLLMYNMPIGNMILGFEYTFTCLFCFLCQFLCSFSIPLFVLFYEY